MNSESIIADEMQPVVKKVADLLAGKDLSNVEKIILGLLQEHWEYWPITQRDIAKAQPWLGCHPTHEKDIVLNEFETTTRKVREVIRALRVKRQIPILSDKRGYYLPRSNAEAAAFLDRMEREAKARAASSIETYESLNNTLGFYSKVFERIKEIFPAEDTTEQATEEIV